MEVPNLQSQVPPQTPNHHPMKPQSPNEQHEALDMALLYLHHICHNALVAGDPYETLETLQRGLNCMYEQVELANGRRLEQVAIGLN